MTDWLPLGCTRYVVDGDTMFWELSGELTITDVKDYAELVSQLYQQWGHALLYIDASAGISVPSATRRQFTESFRDRPHPNHTVIIGASVLVRAVASFIKGSSKLLLNQDLSVEFLDNESEGRARLAAVREALRKRAASSSKRP